MACPFSQCWFILFPRQKSNPQDFADGSVCKPGKHAEKHCLGVPPGFCLRKTGVLGSSRRGEGWPFPLVLMNTIRPHYPQREAHHVSTLPCLSLLYGKCDASVRLSRPIQPSNQLFCFWPCPSACGILVPQTGIELMSSALGAYSPNHWTSRKSHTSPTFGPLFPPTWESQEDLPTCGRCLLCPPSRT